MNAKEQLNKVRTLLGLEVKLEQMKLENGTVLEAETFEAGKEVFVLAEGDKIPVPAGKYSAAGLAAWTERLVIATTTSNEVCNKWANRLFMFSLSYVRMLVALFYDTIT